eukprot:488865-Hanusia_phi.AAC.4
MLFSTAMCTSLSTPRRSRLACSAGSRSSFPFGSPCALEDRRGGRGWGGTWEMGEQESGIGEEEAGRVASDGPSGSWGRRRRSSCSWLGAWETRRSGTSGRWGHREWGL